MHRLKHVAALALAALLLAACSSDDAAPEQASSASTTTPATTTTTAPCPARGGVDDRTTGHLTVAGEQRTYLVDVPASYDGTAPAALILNWHGNGSNADQQAAYSQLAAVADALVVMPEGTGDPQHFSLIPGPQNPDIQFARAIVEAVSEDFCVNADRVFSTGISNGAGLSAEIACQAPDVFAAVALVAATIAPLGCDPATRIPVLAFHGTADRVVPYDGGPLGGGQNVGLVLPPAEEGIARWADQDGCDPEPAEEPIGDDVVHWTFSGCEADVEFYRVEGGGHVWPGALDDEVREQVLGANTQTIDASALISEWFEDHPRAG